MELVITKIKLDKSIHFLVDTYREKLHQFKVRFVLTWIWDKIL